jgi:deoxyribodipyrimidine photolyase-related protein
MAKAAILLPNQLFSDHPGLRNPVDQVVLFEDPLFYGDAQYPARMHRQKLWLHRASMARHQQALIDQGLDAKIFPYDAKKGACLRLFQRLAGKGITEVVMSDPVDFIAERRLREAAHDTGIELDVLLLIATEI